ncbi:MAG TPA: flagellar hook-basal body complex protein FliE [Bacillota bacterium]|nr:flagellar hook-basal body complex protein FliE [Bacillota bacterium]
MVLRVQQAMQPANVHSTIAQPRTEHESSFANTLKEAIAQVNTDQKVADVKTEMLISGDDVDLHEVMIASQKASITLETTVQVQKKMIDAYNEIMRMQI